MKSNLQKLIAATGLLSSMACVAADDSGVTLSIMGGQALFSDERSLDDDTFYAIGLGYEYGNHWAAELGYVVSEPNIEDTQLSVDIDHIRLDGLYYFGADKFRPYLVAGVGQANYSVADLDEDETFVNGGAGFKYAFNPHVALRGDARAVYSTDESETDFLVGLGLIFKFGQSSKAQATPTPTPPPARDSDKDGVIDAEDQCPNTARGLVIDTKGCAKSTDKDGDGVVDTIDQCPDSAKGAKVDAVGCYVMLKEAVSVSLAVNFASNSDVVLEGAVEEVKKVADFMRQYPQSQVLFEGHTDNSGAADYNRQLSQRRADAVAKILIEQFNIDSSRVQAIGYGEDQPLVDNSSASNRAKNRRVVAVVSATVEKIQQ